MKKSIQAGCDRFWWTLSPLEEGEWGRPEDEHLVLRGAENLERLIEQVKSRTLERRVVVQEQLHLATEVNVCNFRQELLLINAEAVPVQTCFHGGSDGRGAARLRSQDPECSLS